MTKKSELSTIDQYIAGAAPAAKPVLSEIRRVAKLAVPNAQETISHKISALKLDRNFFYFAAFKKHVGIYPPVTADERLKQELLPYALIARVALALSKQYDKS